MNPVIFPGNKKVAYVSREYDLEAKTLSDGEIWQIDGDGDLESAEKLIAPLPIEGIERGERCLLPGDKESVKIGIYDISLNGDNLLYWEKNWGPECSGLWNFSQLSSIYGYDFLSQEIQEQNRILFNGEDLGYWRINDVYWIDNGDFILFNGAPPPIAGSAIQYFDEYKDIQWEFFNSFKSFKRGRDLLLIPQDILVSESMIVFAYGLIGNDGIIDFFVEELPFGERIDLAATDNRKQFALEDITILDSFVDDINILSNEYLIFTQKIKESTYGLFLYESSTETITLIDESVQKPVVAVPRN